ncbi:hypothetical protein [Chryseolinea lacunae]|uniref:Uncharacterized protein n=1 Tax=Chryseolinea lacunae TaxID=2801331 RepID=A0ABS1KZD5_9BACT|nr:hypothetical protein [Chryseolinea lacunae]MBL0743676.1 hypothetical protein [Chryseolinea lacunae]
MVDSSILEGAKQPDILRLLNAGNFELILEQQRSTPKQRWRLFGFLKKDSVSPAGFAYYILLACLTGTLKPNEYTRVYNLDFHRDFIGELNELFRMLLCLENFRNAPHFEEVLAATLVECIRNGAVHIEESANGYPKNPINAKVWMDGAELRCLADKLIEYFKRKSNDRNELEVLFLKAKVTCAIMAHYPESVGPDMNALALKFEKLGETKNAKRYYTPVVNDFTSLVDGTEENLSQPNPEVFENEISIVQSLIDALEGLDRLGEQIDHSLLEKSKETLQKVKDLLKR